MNQPLKHSLSSFKWRCSFSKKVARFLIMAAMKIDEMSSLISGCGCEWRTTHVNTTTTNRQAARSQNPEWIGRSMLHFPTSLYNVVSLATISTTSYKNSRKLMQSVLVPLWRNFFFHPRQPFFGQHLVRKVHLKYFEAEHYDFGRWREASTRSS